MYFLDTADAVSVLQIWSIIVKVPSLTLKHKTVRYFHEYNVTENVHLYLVDDWIVPENMTHW